MSEIAATRQDRIMEKLVAEDRRSRKRRQKQLSDHVKTFTDWQLDRLERFMPIIEKGL